MRALSPGDTTPVDDDIAALVLIDAPMALSDTQLTRFARFLERGGGAMVLAAGMMTQPQGYQASTRPVPWNRLLEPYGVSVQGDLVFDLASNERVGVPVSFGRVYMSYPFWVRALSTQEATVNQDIQTVLLPWASTVDTSAAAAGTVTPLFTTSRAGGVEEGFAIVSPQRDFPRDDLAPRLVGVQVNPLAAEGGDPTRGRVIVVGNAEFVSDNYIGGEPANLFFALNAVDWLVQDDALIAIRSKDRSPPLLMFESEAIQDLVRHGNVIGIPVILVGVGLLRLLRRRRGAARAFQPAVREAVG